MSSIGLDHYSELSTLAAAPLAGAQASPRRVAERFERLLTCFEVVADLFTVILAVFVADYLYQKLELGQRLHYSPNALIAAASGFAIIFILMLDRDGAYRSGNSLLRIKETERSLRVSAQSFLLVFPVICFGGQLVSRWMAGLALLLVPLLLILQKQALLFVVRLLHSRGYGLRRVVIYGAGYTGRRVFCALAQSPKLGLTPEAMVDDDPSMVGERVYELSYKRSRCCEVVSGPVTRDLLRSYKADMVIVAVPSLSRQKFAEVASASEAVGAKFAFVASPSVPTRSWVDYTDIDGLLLGSCGKPAANQVYEFLKRILDVIGASLLLAALSPLLLLTAVLIRLDSPGPALFRQQRVGRFGRLFAIYKFRTMRVEAPAYAYSPRDPKDSRITRIGRFLRRTSFDELPQLINALKGDMSLVGPRPEMPFIVQNYTERHRHRLAVKPGITGLWQISADRDSLIHENIQYDLYYIQNRSLFMDIAILLHTAVFAMRGI